MTLKCWAAAPPPPPRKRGTLESSLAPSVETLLAQTHTRSGLSGRHARSPPAGKSGSYSRARSQSNNWDPSKSTGAEMEEVLGEDAFDPSSATIPAPAHAMPALWVNGRRRQHTRRRLRRRSASENCNPNLSRSNSSTPPSSTSSTMSSTMSTTLSSSMGSSTLRSALSSSSLLAQAQAEELARRVSAEEADTAPSKSEVNRRVRILKPEGSSVHFGGWIRGQEAEVQWEVLDNSVKCVRIDVCNVAWNVPTTIAHRVANDGEHRWRRVYWGMPIAEGYYVNIYDVTEQAETGAMPLLAQSERFAVIK